jgi:uncharacterized protein (DUF2147 family)
MKKYLIALGLALTSSLALAQASPVGLWKTIDDKTGKERTLVRITERGGALFGVIEKRLDPNAVADAKCDKCTDDRKDKPIQGLEIIRDAKKDGDVWEGGTILNPEEGKIYKLRLKLEDGGKSLEVRGYIAMFFRNQKWQRVE